MLRVMGPRGAVPAAGSLWTANGTDHVFWKHFHSGETQVRVPKETGQHLMYKEKKIQFFSENTASPVGSLQRRSSTYCTKRKTFNCSKKNIQFFSENIASLVGSLQRRSSIRYNKCCVAADCKCTYCTFWIVCFWRYHKCTYRLFCRDAARIVPYGSLQRRSSNCCTLWIVCFWSLLYPC